MKSLVCASLLALLSVNTHAATYAIDPTHTFVTFEIEHFVSTNRGRFDKKEGLVEFDRGAGTGRVDLTIDTASINTGTPAFNRFLMGKEVFNVEEFPSAKFVADSFVFNGSNLKEVPGMLTLRGKSLPVTLKANQFSCIENPMLKREVCGGNFEATIQRQQWGIGFGLERGYPDTVRLVIQVEAIRQ